MIFALGHGCDTLQGLDGAEIAGYGGSQESFAVFFVQSDDGGPHLRTVEEAACQQQRQQEKKGNAGKFLHGGTPPLMEAA
jgi:hypothetical protein